MLGRIKASIDDPLGLESAGFALFDMYPERRGNLYSDEVYRLTKAVDATTVYPRSLEEEDGEAAESSSTARYLPPNHKFSTNDVIMVTMQPKGSGDFFGPATLPTNEDALSVEARVLNMGPTYVDIALPAGSFEAAFGPAPNDLSGNGDKRLRLRADRFISKVPYQRMVAAVAQTATIPERQKRSATPEEQVEEQQQKPHDSIHMDEVIREAILSTHAYADPYSPMLRDPDACDLQQLVSSHRHHARGRPWIPLCT